MDDDALTPLRRSIDKALAKAAAPALFTSPQAIHPDDLISDGHTLRRPTMAQRTEHEWRVTGQPGPILHKDQTVAVEFPYYRHVWTDAGALKYGQAEETTAELAARGFIRRVKTGKHPWLDGPHLEHRTVTYTDWENVRA